MNNQKDLTNQRFGKLTAIRLSANPYISPTNKKINKWVCQCDCGNIKEINIYSLIHNKSKSCGCNHRTHNLTNTPEYSTWSEMKSRCTNVNHPRYNNYGERGIQVCQKWLDSFEAFIKDVGKRPSKNHSLDRIDNDGNYTKDNVRWTNSTVQSINRRKKSTNTSGVTGVSYNKHAKKWNANIGVNKKYINLGYYDTKEEAILARKAGEEKYHKPLL